MAEGSRRFPPRWRADKMPGGGGPGHLRSFVGLDLNLMAHVVDVPLQEVRDLLDRGTEREPVP
jgi:hypothetical protein